MNTKYKIEMSRGCTADAFLVNGEDYFDLPKEKRDEFVEYVFVKIKEAMDRSEMQIHQFIEMFEPDNWETSPQCDQCGDSVTTQIWDL